MKKSLIYPYYKMQAYLFALVAILVQIFPLSSLANMDVINDTQDTIYYGNAANTSFNDAIVGNELDPEDQAFLRQVDVSRVFQRWYLRGVIGQPAFKLKKVRNISSGGAYQGYPPVETSTKDDLYQLLLSVGYKGYNFSFDGELIFNETLKYGASPLLFQTNIQGKADINTVAFLANVNWYFPKFFTVIPEDLYFYLRAGAGGSLNRTELQTFNLAGQQLGTGSTSKLKPAFQGGIGAQYQVSSRFLVDFAIRYIYYGSATFQTVSDISLKANEIRSFGYYLGTTFQF